MITKESSQKVKMPQKCEAQPFVQLFNMEGGLDTELEISHRIGLQSELVVNLTMPLCPRI